MIATSKADTPIVWGNVHGVVCPCNQPGVGQGFVHSKMAMEVTVKLHVQIFHLYYWRADI